MLFVSKLITSRFRFQRTWLRTNQIARIETGTPSSHAIPYFISVTSCYLAAEKASC